MVRNVFIVLTFVCFIARCQGYCRAQDISVARIAESWEARAKRSFRAGRVLITGDHLLPKGSISKTYPVKAGVPADDKRVSRQYRLLVSNGKISFETTGPRYSAVTDSFFDSHDQSVFDGKVGHVLTVHDSPTPDAFTKTGYIDKNGDASFPVEMLPLFYVLHPELMNFKEKFQFASESHLSNGKKGIKFISLNQLFHAEMILDKDDFSVLELSTRTAKDAKLISITTIAYSDSQLKFVDSWESVTYHVDGTLLEHAKFSVTEADFASEVNDREFVLDFPPGTLVRDRTSAVANDRFLVLNDGSWRPVTPAEQDKGLPPSVLMKTSPGESLDGNGGIFVFCFVSIVIVAMGGLLFRLGYWKK